MSRGWGLWAVLGAVLMMGCAEASKRPDILLISIDTLRADRLGSYGYAAAHTPNLDRLAAEGVRFANCQSPIPVTLPAHATMLTGRLPADHGVRNNATYRLPESIPTVAEKLKELGYRNGAFVGAFPLQERFGLARGFDMYDDSLEDEAASQFQLQERSAATVIDSAMRWLGKQSKDEPVFMWVHFFEPHAPYRPLAPFDTQFAANPYDGEVATVDRAVGKLLRSFDLLRSEDQLTVITSDHGEGLGDHGEPSHAVFLYQSTLHVPLLIHAPGIWPADRVIEEPVGLVDLAPTLLVAAGGDATAFGGGGIALIPGQEPPRRALASESLYGMQAFRWSPLFALREGRHKVIRSAISHAYDLEVDPGELNDLLGEADWADAMLADLELQVARSAEGPQADEAARQPTPEETEALAALGYVGGVPESNVVRDDDALLRAMRDLPDPTTRIEEFKRTQSAEALIERGDFDDAVAVLQEVVATNEENVWANMLLGRALGAGERFEEAIASFQRAADLRPNWMETHVSLARLHGRAGDVSRAGFEYGAALDIDAANLDVRVEAAGYLQQEGRLEAARRVLAAAPDYDARVFAGLARVDFQLGDLASGRAALAKARVLDDDPSLITMEALYLRSDGDWQGIVNLLTAASADVAAYGEAQLYLGESLQRLGRHADAVQSYERALAVADSLHLAHNNLAWALTTEMDEQGRALTHALRAIELRPNQPDYHDSYLEVLERSGRQADAVQHLRPLLERFPDHASLAARAKAYGLR